MKPIPKKSGLDTTRGHPRHKISALQAQGEGTFTKPPLLLDISSTNV